MVPWQKEKGVKMKNDDFNPFFVCFSKQVAVTREVQSISDLHKLENSDSSKSAFHDKKKLREGIYIPQKREEQDEQTHSMDRKTKEWSICSTKSSSSEPTDEEIADLVQR
jgi:hypothetical protein